ncbi:hypothetical protein H4219_006376, partial [Mycoemilia scoparia]
MSPGWADAVSQHGPSYVRLSQTNKKREFGQNHYTLKEFGTIKHRRIERMDVSGGYRSAKGPLKKIIKHIPNMKAFSLCSGSAGPESLEKVFKENQQLENVGLFANKTPIKDLLPALNVIVQNLQSLDLDVKATSEQLKCLLDNLPDIESLRLRGEPAREIWRLENVFDIPANGPLKPAIYRNLKSLAIVSNKVYGNPLNYKLSYIDYYFPNLVSLELSILRVRAGANEGYSEQEVLQHKEAVFMYEATFNQLKTLKISFLSPSIIVKFPTFFPHLKSLDFKPQTWYASLNSIEAQSIQHLLKSSTGSNLTSFKTEFPVYCMVEPKDCVFIDHTKKGSRTSEVTRENMISQTVMHNLVTLDLSTLVMSPNALFVFNKFPKLQVLKIALRSLVHIKEIAKAVRFNELVVLDVRFALK